MRVMTMKSLCAVLGLALLSVACGAKKLWGVDVGDKKEERGEFESLLKKASGQEVGGGAADGVGQALQAFADMDLSKLSLSELCTSAIDAIIDIVQDEQWLEQFAEPGVMSGLIDKSGMAAMMGEDGMAPMDQDDLKELLALEGSPILYKTKFYELAEKQIGKLIQLRMQVSDPAKLRSMIRDALKSNGLGRDEINQVMQMVDHPEMLAEQISALLSDPAVVGELTKAFDSFTNAASMLEQSDLGDFDTDELSQLLATLQDDPAAMEEVYAEMMKDPALAELLKGQGGADMFNEVGARQDRGQRVEL